jgi:hypothetical protein
VRSSTMPVLCLGSTAASLVSNVSGVDVDYVEERQSEDHYNQHQRERRQVSEGFEDNMQFYLPGGAMKYAQPPKIEGTNEADMSRSGATHTSFTDNSTKDSPISTATDGKKKPGLFGTKRPKALDRPNSSSQAPLMTSPLPPTTPSKAAQFFGLEPKPRSTDSPRRGQLHDDGTTDEDAPVRPTLRKQVSLPLLTRSKLGADITTKSKEAYVEPDLPKQKKANKTGKNKGLRMLIPAFAGSKRAVIQHTTAATTHFDLDKDDADIDYSNDSKLYEHRFRIPASTRPVPAVPRRRVRKKSPKSLERMSPITETSFEELLTAYHEDEDATELGVISEYEYDDPPYSAGGMLPRSHTESVIPHQNAFELDEDGLSPKKGFDDDELADEEDCAIHPGTKVDVKRVRWQQPTTMCIRSPLQTIEDDYLDSTEESMRLQARRMTVDRVEAEKRAMDCEHAVLRFEHEKKKLNFENIKTRGHVCANPEPAHEGSDEDDNDLVSLCSSIDLDEEPLVHEAKVVTFTRITPGMVKFVDIPLSIKKAVLTVESNAPVIDTPEAARHDKKAVTTPENGENVPPTNVSPSKRSIHTLLRTRSLLSIHITTRIQIV